MTLSYGPIVRDVMTGGGVVTFRVAVLEIVPSFAVMVIELAVALVVIENVALFAPAGTRTLVGSDVAVVFEVLNETERPPVGAFALRVTVPTDGVPTGTLVSERESEAS